MRRTLLAGLLATPVLAACSAAAVGSTSVNGSGPTTGASAPSRLSALTSGGVDQPPVGADVASGRFVRAAKLDDGAVQISPAGRGEQPALNAQRARDLFGSDPRVIGSHSGQLLGIALVTVEPSLGVPLNRTLAWVGMVWGGVTGCPAMQAAAGTGTAGPQPPTPGYRVVILVSPQRVYDYESRGSFCGSPPAGPTAGSALETVSVPWQLESYEHGTLAIRYRAPSCGAGAGAGAEPSMSFGGTVGGEGTLTVEGTLPFDRPGCPDVQREAQVSTGPPPGFGAPFSYAHIAHGPTGPVGGFSPVT